MLMYCYEKWNANRDKLEAKFRDNFDFGNVSYTSLLALTVECIFNDSEHDVKWDTKKITTIDDGDYQGTLLLLIPQDTYQPAEYEYLNGGTQMIDIRNYKVVHKDKVYHGLSVRPEFEAYDGDTFGEVLNACALEVIAMNLNDGGIVRIWDKASEFGFVKVG